DPHTETAWWGGRPRSRSVGLGFAGEAEDALGHDVALDLVGAAADRDRRRGEEAGVRLGVARVGDAGEALHVDGEAGDRLHGPGQPDLPAGALGTRREPGLHAG